MSKITVINRLNSLSTFLLFDVSMFFKVGLISLIVMYNGTKYVYSNIKHSVKL